MDPEVKQELDIMKQQHAELKLAVSKQQEAIAENTALTKSVFANTSEIVVFFKDLKSGIKLLSYLGSVAKWLAIIAAGAAVIVTIFKTGQLPPAKL